MKVLVSRNFHLSHTMPSLWSKFANHIINSVMYHDGIAYLCRGSKDGRSQAVRSPTKPNK